MWEALLPPLPEAMPRAAFTSWSPTCTDTLHGLREIWAMLSFLACKDHGKTVASPHPGSSGSIQAPLGGTTPYIFTMVCFSVHSPVNPFGLFLVWHS